MSFQPTQTSDLRRVLCQRICQVVYRSGDEKLTAWLAKELERFPFERRSDDELVTMARQLLVPKVDDLVARFSAFRYATTAAAPLLGERTTL